MAKMTSEIAYTTRNEGRNSPSFQPIAEALMPNTISHSTSWARYHCHCCCEMIAKRGESVPGDRLDGNRLNGSAGEESDDRYNDVAEPEPDRPPILFLPELAPAS